MVFYIISGNALCLFSEDRWATHAYTFHGRAGVTTPATFAVLEEGSAFEETLAPSAVTGKPHSGLALPPGTITAEPVFPAV